VAECEKVDLAVSEAQKKVIEGKKEIEEMANSANGDMYKLIDITTKIGSGATPSGGESSYKQNGISLIRSQNIHDNEFVVKGLAFIDEEQASKLNNVTVEQDDVLFNITGASVARCCIVDITFLPARVNQHVAIIRANEKVISKYLQLILTAPKSKEQLLNMAGNGSTRESITKVQLENFKIPVPPLSEQQKLVSAIEQIENQITDNQTIINQSSTQKQAVMKQYL
jgi:restriction endonuclease S subunit